ncbi:hypothetical protein ANN_22476 [Periplaneta americana]|uniref:HAT C-terminal dimerisation domain-containing protein n=1 Tax=Periplaneta americana TaxID=6978 RepID=A0ABQ8S8Q8_PERAM|nr:hypothetical protein ANN_22476 [Periplaneta americana]
MLDEITDIAKLSQFFTVIRYVQEGEIQERFLGFTDVSNNRSIVALSEHVFRILSDFQCEDKLVAQGYDGAATFSGHLNGLQALTKTFGVNYCIRKVKETISFIQESRNNFDDMYATLEDSNTNKNEPRKCQWEGELDDPRMRYLRLYEIIDTIVNQMENRFRGLEELKFIELIDSKKYESFKTRFPEILFTSFKSGFHFENLRSELVAVYRLSEFSGRTVTEIAKFLKETELGEDSFPEVCKLSCLIATIPVSTSTVECTSSCLKCIKSYVRNTQCEDRLSRLSLLSIKKALLNKAKDIFTMTS